MNKLFGILYQDVPVYFAVNGHRYVLVGYFDDEFGRGPDPLAAPNHFELRDIETGKYVGFSGKNAEKQLSDYPLSGGATIKADMATFDYVLNDGWLQDKVEFRVLVSSRFTEGFFHRLHGACARLGMRLLDEECRPYWKVNGMSEISVTADHAPEQTIEAWQKVFEELFFHKDYHIEDGSDAFGPTTCICRYTTVEETEHLDTEAYFVIMRIANV